MCLAYQKKKMLRENISAWYKQLKWNMRKKNHKLNVSNITRLNAPLLVTYTCKLKIARFIDRENILRKKKKPNVHGITPYEKVYKM